MQRPAARVVGVRRLADYLRLKIERDPHLTNVSVRGELTNLSVGRTGHLNFDLKEGEAVLAAFAWQSDATNFPALKNGLAVIATGSVSAYVKRSLYQLAVRDIELAGVGDVHALFEERKKRLAAEGIFDVERKRPLPKFPFALALVSSRASDGAVDFTKILRERAPHVRIVWCETSVQGSGAASEIVAALERASRADVDCIVVARGGGSFEDLFVFSDENVVRAVACARHPVLSAIGHAADQQLCDFAADGHFETPSAAAKALGSATSELLGNVEGACSRARRAVTVRLERLRGRLSNALVRSKLSDPRLFFAPLAHGVAEREDGLETATAARLRALRECLHGLGRRIDVRDPTRRLAERGRRLEAARGRLDAAARARLVHVRNRSAEVSARLEPLARAVPGRCAGRLAIVRAHLDGKNPEAILQRGYAIVTYGDTIVRDPALVPEGARIAARVAHGTLVARVEHPHGECRQKEADGDQRSG